MKQIFLYNFSIQCHDSRRKKIGQLTFQKCNFWKTVTSSTSYEDQQPSASATIALDMTRNSSSILLKLKQQFFSTIFRFKTSRDLKGTSLMSEDGIGSDLIRESKENHFHNVNVYLFFPDKFLIQNCNFPIDNRRSAV